MKGDSKVVRSRGGLRWEGVEAEVYRPAGEGSPAVTRHVLLGEREGEEGLNFVTRYFELPAGTCSTLERHSHAHTVLVMHGQGRVILGDEVHELSPLDCVYVAPDCLHQFHAAGPEPLGFLCIVDRERGPSIPPTQEELVRLRTNPAGAELRGG